MRVGLVALKKSGEYKSLQPVNHPLARGVISLAILFLTACSSVEYTSESAPGMIVVNEGAPFFIHGPAQGSGSDRTLAGGNEVKVLRREFGYSLVQLRDGQQGYVANEALIPAPYSSPTHSEEHPTRKKKKSLEFSEMPAFRY